MDRERPRVEAKEWMARFIWPHSAPGGGDGIEKSRQKSLRRQILSVNTRPYHLKEDSSTAFSMSSSPPSISSSPQPKVPEHNSLMSDSRSELKSPVPKSLPLARPKMHGSFKERIKKYQLKYRYRKRPIISYLYLHNHRRKVPRKKSSQQTSTN